MAVACALSVGVLTSCSNVDNDDEEKIYQENFTFELNNNSEYDAEGVWTGVYSTDMNTLIFRSMLGMSHSASITEYEGVEYKSWKGFCPTRVTDNADHAGDWTNYQWGSIAGGGFAESLDYIIGCWDVQESTTSVPTTPSMMMVFAGSGHPMSVMVCNSAYTYYTLKNGDAFCKRFTEADWFKVIFIGLKNGMESGRVEYYLARNGNISSTWEQCDLRELGYVDGMYIQMASSDESQWGMNTPAYVCLDNLVVNIKY